MTGFMPKRCTGWGYLHSERMSYLIYLDLLDEFRFIEVKSSIILALSDNRESSFVYHGQRGFLVFIARVPAYRRISETFEIIRLDLQAQGGIIISI